MVLMKLDRTRDMDSFFALLRLLVVAAVTIWGVFAPLDEHSRSSFFACLSASSATGLILYWVLQKRLINSKCVYKLAFFADLALIFWAVQVTGGNHSSLILGFYWLVAFHSFHSGFRVGFAAAISASVLIMTLPDAGMWWGDSVIRIGFLQMLAIGAGLLSERERLFAHDLSETRRAVEQAQKMAALGTLGAGIAHEVNNPTSSIIARAERILLEAHDRGLPEETIKDFEVIRKHAIRIGTILQRLLAFARPEGFDSRPLNLNCIIEEMIPLLEGRLREKRLSLSLNLVEDAPLLLGDRTRLEEVILNILNNAIDASYWGSVIDVSTEIRNKSLEFRVTDRGIGIDPKNLPHVFDPFFSTKPADQGTGLGLYVAWQIVNDHGATVDISSEPHRGTTVTVRLPLLSETERQATARAQRQFAVPPG